MLWRSLPYPCNSLAAGESRNRGSYGLPSGETSVFPPFSGRRKEAHRRYLGRFVVCLGGTSFPMKQRTRRRSRARITKTCQVKATPVVSPAQPSQSFSPALNLKLSLNSCNIWPKAQATAGPVCVCSTALAPTSVPSHTSRETAIRKKAASGNQCTR